MQELDRAICSRKSDAGAVFCCMYAHHQREKIKKVSKQPIGGPHGKGTVLFYSFFTGHAGQLGGLDSHK